MEVQTEKRTLMNSHPFGAFIGLIALDQEIRSIHEKIAQLQEESTVFLTQKKDLSDRLHQFKQHVAELRSMVAAQELEMKTLDEQESIKRTQLDQTTNIKEYQPLKKEIDQLKHVQHQAENHLMSIWNKLEIAQKEFETHQTDYMAKIEEVDHHLANAQSQIAKLTDQLEEKKQQRPHKENGIPQEWLEKYSHMRLQVHDPVVPVSQDSCSACSYTIPGQELVRLKRRALVQCKGCFRLLFMQEAMKENIPDSHS